MGKHKKSNPNPPNSSTISKKSSNDPDQNRIDLLTSRLLELCGGGQKKSGPNQSTPTSLWKEFLEIRPLVQELRKLQSSNTKNSSELSPTPTTDRSDRLKILVDWCSKNGVKSDGISIDEFETKESDDESSWKTYGLKTERDIVDIGQLLVSVPRRLFLSVENFLQRNEPFKPLFLNDPLLHGMANVALSFVLMMEKSKSSYSFWSPYLDSLPARYETPLTVLLDEDDDGDGSIDMMRGSIVFEEVLKLFKNLVRQYSYFYQSLRTPTSVLAKTMAMTKILTPKNLTFDAYFWATITVMTRINFVPPLVVPNYGAVPALIPFFDMANHADIPPCTDFVDEEETDARQSAVIFSSKEYQAGDQIHIFYGIRKYWEFFVYNGFAYDDSKNYPNVLVKMGLSKGDPLYKVKETALQNSFLMKSEDCAVYKYSYETTGRIGPFPNGLLRFALIFSSNEDELKAFNSIPVAANSTFQFSDRTKDEAKKFLIARFQLLLKSYKNQDDETKGTNVENGHWKRKMIRKYIRSEMDSLRSGLEYLESGETVF